MKESNDYYKQVEQEIGEGKYQEGMRTRAIAEAGGDENKARALYIKIYQVPRGIIKKRGNKSHTQGKGGRRTRAASRA